MSFHRTNIGIGDATSELNSIAGSIQNIFKLGTSGAPTSTQIEGSVGSALLAAAPLSGPAAPILAAAGAVSDMLAQFGVGSGCGATCVESTQYANAAESALQENINAYFSIPAPRSTADQQLALSNYEQVWNDLVAQCRNPQLGSAGQRCISDRQAGACTWHQTTTPPWGTPVQGACWNWDSGYRAPIANDPDVSDPTAALANATGGTTGVLSSSSSWLPIALIGGLLVLGLAVSK